MLAVEDGSDRLNSGCGGFEVSSSGLVAGVVVQLNVGVDFGISAFRGLPSGVKWKLVC